MGNSIKKIYLFLHVLIIIFSIILSKFYSIDALCDNFDRNIIIIGWLTNVILLVCIYYVYKIKNNILDYNIVFLIFFFLFSFGQIFLVSIGIEKKGLSIFKLFSEYEIMTASIYFYYSLLFYILGLLLVIKKTDDKIYKADIEFNVVVLRFAILLFAISIVPFLYVFIPTLFNSVIYGYKYLYYNPVEVSGTIGYLSKFFIPSLFMILYVKSNSKFISRIIVFSIIFLSFGYFLIGTRGGCLTLLISLLIFYSAFIKHINGKKILKIIPLVLVMTLIIPIGFSFRKIANKDFESFHSIFSETLENTEENFLVKSISELGGSMQAFILTYQVVPSVSNYKYGESYLASILMLIPSNLLGGYTFANKAALDTWLQNIHNMSYGPGFSIIAENFYNFGWEGGIIFSAVIGMFFTYIFNLTSKDRNRNCLLNLLSFVFLFNSMTRGRFPFHGTIRNLVYMYLIVYFLIIYLYSRNERRRIQ